MKDAVIKVEGVSKKYCKSLKKSIAYGISDIGRNVCGLRTKSEKLRQDEFWALDGVSFELEKSQSLGIVGPNGAGKTTLLKLLNGIFMPDKGKIEVRGKVGGLIELGAGFHPMLTGRENIYVNGAILGMGKKEIDKKLDSIIKFADIGDFLDCPVKYYSSGMFVRLGFAVAIHSQPEILLLDEILSVGDTLFQEKCIRHVEKMRQGMTTVFVSHNLYRIEAICDRVMWLNQGKTAMMGDTQKTISAYMDDIENQKLRTMPSLDLEKISSVDKPVIVEKVELADLNGKTKNEFAFGEGLIVQIYYQALKRIERPLFNLRIMDRDSGIIEAGMLIDGYGPDYIEGRGIMECRFESLPLTPKIYEILLFIRSSGGMADIANMDIYCRFRVTEENLNKIPMAGPMALNHLRQGSPIYVPHNWNWKTNH